MCLRMRKINAIADVPGNWHPLWGWKRTLPTAEEAAAEARDAAKRKMAVAAQMKAQAQAEKDFDLKYKCCRKCTKLGKEMRSLSDLLREIDTAKATTVRSTSGEKVPVWAKKRFNWQANNWSTDASCGSHDGSGREGHVASYEALKDIWNFVC